MPFFTSPTSFRNANLDPSLINLQFPPFANPSTYDYMVQSTMSLNPARTPRRHSSHPDFAHLALLVFEAVLEVVCVSLPGYIVARRGLFNQEMQKFAANLNVLLFTPCLSTCDIIYSLP